MLFGGDRGLLNVVCRRLLQTYSYSHANRRIIHPAFITKRRASSLSGMETPVLLKYLPK